jgi:hypothetical protein
MEPHGLLVIKVSKGTPTTEPVFSQLNSPLFYFIFLSIPFNGRPLTPSLILGFPSELSHGFRTVTTLRATFPTCQILLDLITLINNLG